MPSEALSVLAQRNCTLIGVPAALKAVTAPPLMDSLVNAVRSLPVTIPVPGLVPAARTVVPALRPSAASALPVPEMTRSWLVPVESTSLPELTVEAVVAPVMLSIALSTLCTVSVLVGPMPIVTLPEESVVEVVCAVEKVMVLPLTVRDAGGVIAVARSLDVALAVPTNWVAAVIAAGVVLSLLTAVPVKKALTGGAGVPNGKGLEAKSAGLMPRPR